MVILLGLWPLVLLATPGILIYCLCRLIALEKRPASAVPAASPAPPAPPAPASEQSALTVAFGITYLLYQAKFPWQITDTERGLTEDKLTEMFNRYVGILTDEAVPVEEQSVENGG